MKIHNFTSVESQIFYSPKLAIYHLFGCTSWLRTRCSRCYYRPICGHLGRHGCRDTSRWQLIEGWVAFAGGTGAASIRWWCCRRPVAARKVCAPSRYNFAVCHRRRSARWLGAKMGPPKRRPNLGLARRGVLNCRTAPSWCAISNYNEIMCKILSSWVRTSSNVA